MSHSARLNVRWSTALATAIVFVALGAAGSYVAMRSLTAPAAVSETSAALETRTSPSPTSGDLLRSADSSPLPDVIVTLTDEAMKRAGIEIATVEAGSATDVLRLPAVVEPNAYARVSVTPLVTGRVTSVSAQLGAQVRQGQTLATVFSPELADAQTQYISARAELDAHERELARTEKLVQIGAASRQELERIHAEHTAQQTRVESARSRLDLLGMSREAVESLASGKSVDASTEVPAPIAGVVTERLVNMGLNVDPATKLFTVVDLSTVWIVANLYEKDFARVRVGDHATVVTPAYPDRQIQGRVSYIDPQVSPESRTTKVRVEVSNPHYDLRLGMLAEAQIQASTSTSVAFIPRIAVQNVADRSFVYVAKPGAPGQFMEREVLVGQPSGERIQVVSGVVAGDKVVAEGSFFMRAERERLGLRP
jgi:cobalt-zinc-cadmium efflux system membrane fusion protein